MLAHKFAHEDNYDKIQEDDTFNFLNLRCLNPGSTIKMEVVHTNGKKDLIYCYHTYNEQQIEWFKAGSALNLIKQQNKELL